MVNIVSGKLRLSCLAHIVQRFMVLIKYWKSSVWSFLKPILQPWLKNPVAEVSRRIAKLGLQHKSCFQKENTSSCH